MKRSEADAIVTAARGIGITARVDAQPASAGDCWVLVQTPRGGSFYLTEWRQYEELFESLGNLIRDASAVASRWREQQCQGADRAPVVPVEALDALRRMRGL